MPEPAGHDSGIPEEAGYREGYARGVADENERCADLVVELRNLATEETQGKTAMYMIAMCSLEWADILRRTKPSTDSAQEPADE